ncbi:MAG: hypothetical protein KDC87_05705, partial [Planctomycetes bacterium]|nr:hypothetical protein [Planctomycetota bacterium]
LPFAYLSFATTLQIGVRYVLPQLALLCLLAARPVAALWSGGRTARAVLAMLTVWVAATAGLQWPHNLGAMNALAGARPYRLFGDSTVSWQLVPGDDPALRTLLSRHAGAQRLYPRAGPRLGVVVLHARDAWPGDAAEFGPLHHWLDPFVPCDHEGSFFCFDVTAELYREALRRSTPNRARWQRDFAVALLGAGAIDAAAAEIDELESPDPLLAAQLARLRAKPRDPRAVLAGWSQLGRADRVLADSDATAGERAHAHFVRGDYVACREVLEPLQRTRRLQQTEALELMVAQVRSLAVRDAIATVRAYSPPADSPAFPAHAQRLAQLEALWADLRTLGRQCGLALPE